LLASAELRDTRGFISMHDRDRGVAHALVLLVGQRHRRRDGDRVAGVHAHRIEVLDRADDDRVVLAVADDLELELLPAEDALLDQDRVHRRLVEAELHHAVELALVVGDAAARAAEREARAQDRGEPDLVDRGARLLDGGHQRRARAGEADPRHRLLEQLAILGHLDARHARAEELDAVLREDAGLVRGEREVEAGLAAERGQDRARLLAREHLVEHLDGQRLDVRRVRQIGVRHDRRGVRVDQHHAQPLLAEGLARLRARVVELGRLADHDRSGPDDQHRLQIFTARHRQPIYHSRADRKGPRSGDHRSLSRCAIWRAS